MCQNVPDPTGRAFSAPPDPLDGFGEGERKMEIAREGRGMKFREGSGEEEWKGIEMEKE